MLTGKSITRLWLWNQRLDVKPVFLPAIWLLSWVPTIEEKLNKRERYRIITVDKLSMLQNRFDVIGLAQMLIW